MPTPAKGPRMGGSPAHERLMLANLATALFEHGRITTTESKAKRLRPYAEHLITFGKRGDLHARRQVLKRLRDKGVVHALFDEIGPRYANRPGGYTRIVKLGPRKGDNAPMALIELVEALTVGQQAVGEAERARGTRFAGSRPVTGATAESAAELAPQSPVAAAVAEEAAAQESAVDDAALPPETADEDLLDEQLDEMASVADAGEAGPADEVPVGEVPVGEVPVGEVPVGEVPVGEVPVAPLVVTPAEAPPDEPVSDQPLDAPPQDEER